MIGPRGERAGQRKPHGERRLLHPRSAELPGTARMNEATAWRGRLFLGTGWLLYAGPIGPTSAHAHHAFQLLISAHELMLQGVDDPSPVPCRAAVIPCDAVHTTLGLSQAGTIAYVDPDTARGRGLRMLLDPGPRSAETWIELGQKLREASPLAVPRSWEEARSAWEQLVDALLPEDTRGRPVHPAVTRAMAIVDSAGLECRLSTTAELVGISEGRLSHLFSESVGIPFRVYVLWRRLQRAAGALATGASVTEAAHAAGFADGPHFSRTCRRMFGIAPSDVAGVADWITGPGAHLDTR
jgi:AraC-like DNA-binding protein